MNIFQRAKEYFAPSKKIFLKASSLQTPENSATKAIEKERAYYGTQVFQTKKDIMDWKQAVDNATRPPYFRKNLLYDVCKQASFDGLVVAQTETRKNGVLSEKFVLTLNGKDITKEIEKPYFRSIIGTILESVFWWCSAIELRKNAKNEVDIFVIPPQYICNERRLILPNPRGIEGISIDVFENLLMFTNEDVLGIFAKVAKYTIYKGLSESDWAQHSETFGKPWLVMKTDETDNTRLEVRKNSLANMGANPFTIIGMDEDLMAIDTKQQSPETMYKTLIETAEKNISWIMVGQQATSDQKSFVGSAEVQERILSWYITADMIYTQNAINLQVLPLLAKLGIIPEGCFFDWQYFIDKKAPAKAKANETKANPANEKQKANEDKAKAKLAFNLAGEDFNDFWDNPEKLLAYWEALFIRSLDTNSSQYASFLKNAKDFAQAKYDTYLKNIKDLSKEEAKLQYLLLQSYSEAESNHFQASMQMASEWQSILDDEDLYPNLRYQAVGDKNTRPDHLALSGIVKPVKDAFWDKYYPPISYRCRCTVRQEEESVKVTKGTPKDLPKIPKGLEGNPGKTGYAFSQNHPYFNK